MEGVVEYARSSVTVLTEKDHPLELWRVFLLYFKQVASRDFLLFRLLLAFSSTI